MNDLPRVLFVSILCVSLLFLGAIFGLNNYAHAVDSFELEQLELSQFSFLVDEIIADQHSSMSI